MATSAQLRKQILQGSWDAVLAALYGADPAVLQRQRGRYAAALEQFELYFGPRRQVQVYSAPGRAELGGNHTDHQGGYGLAAAVTLDLVAVAARNTDGYVRVKSRGFNKLDVIDLATAEPQAGESTHSASLIRGIAEGFRAVGKQIGGFDERFAPAYCEDSDLAFEVRKAGYRVVYQPLSKVIHFEGVSNGTDVNGTGLKRYQVENSQKLKEKWADEFKKQCVNDGNPNPFRARERSQGKKVILVVDHYVPTFDKDAGSKTTYQYLKMFLKKGYVVKFLGDNFLHEEPYSTTLQQMGIEILPPDINHGMYGFSVDNGAIRYALSAIKSIGRPVIEGIVREREEHGEYTSLKTFVERNIDQINKRVVENLIKAGALDCLEGNRKQKMTIYTQIIDSINQDKKHTMAGQLSLFDIASEEDKKEFEIRMPQVEEYPKEIILTFEKEVLGIYLSGHPLERYRNMMEKMISAKTSDFQPDDETGIPEVYDNQKVIVGGMITDKTIKYTKNNKVMAFLTVEDLVGTVEVVVFPRDYEKCQMFLNEDARLFIQGRVSAEDDKASKLILEKVRTFDDMPKELWIQFESREDYAKAETGLVDDLMSSRGNSSVVIYLKDVKAMKKLPPAYQVHIEDSWLEHMCEKYGSSNVKIVDRVLKNL